jgi:phytoene synthase
MASNPQSLVPNPELDRLVRRVDEDRWLALRFAPGEVRARLIALYAVNYEIARTAEIVSEAALGDIRLEWWRSALEQMAEGSAPPPHPALAAFYATTPYVNLAYPLITIAETRAVDLAPAPFKTWGDLEKYVAGTARVLMYAATECCGVSLTSADHQRFRECAALAWAYVGLLRSEPVWTARGRSFLPEGATGAEMLARARTAYDEAHALSAALPVETFPAYGYVALVPGYARALEQGRRETPQLGRKAILIAASARGRI